MAHFFRYEPDGLTNMNMLLIRIAFIVMLYLAYRFKERRTLLIISIFVSVLLQIVMFVWYAGDNNLFLREGLPLYHCRIAALMTALGYFLNKKSFTRYFAWLGLIGSVIAFAFPDPAPFLWPHLTNITYMGTHIVIGMSSLIILTEENNKLNARAVASYTLGMNIILGIANHLFNSNYGYLMKLPKLFPFTLDRTQLFIIMFILIAVGIFSCENIYVLIKNKLKENSIY